MNESAAPRARGRRAALTAWLLMGVAGLAGAALLSARGDILQPSVECAFQAATGLSCPTCGATRAVVRLLRGDLVGAWTAHPLATPLAVQLVLAWVLGGSVLLVGRPRRLGRWVPLALGVDAAAVLAVWLARLVTGSVPT